MGNLLPTRRSSGVNCGSSSSNAGGGGALPHDVLFEILLRVPAAKQLCRLRAVSRSWRAVLSDPRFAAAHGARHPDPHMAVSVRGILEEEAGVLILDASGRVVDRAASCAGTSYPRNPPMRAHRGLVLIVGTDEWDHQRRRRRQRLRVLDPATGAVSLLPHHGDDDGTVSFFVLGWAAAASASTGSQGGGSAGGYYKVISITDDGDHHGASVQLSCKVLTLGAGVWREVQKPPATVRREHACVAAVAAGVVYVLALRPRVNKTDWIAAFDLETEQWRPGLLRGPRTSNALSSLTTNTDGHLVAVSGSFSYASSVDLWLLVGGGDGWGKREAVWQKMCTVPMGVERTRRRRSHLEEQEQLVAEPQPLWVLNGGKAAFLVWSPVTLKGRLAGTCSATGMVTHPNWVLHVYDPRSSKPFQHFARRFWYSTDVAVGVYNKNNLLRVQGVHSELF